MEFQFVKFQFVNKVVEIVEIENGSPTALIWGTGMYDK